MIEGFSTIAIQRALPIEVIKIFADNLPFEIISAISLYVEYNNIWSNTIKLNMHYELFDIAKGFQKSLLCWFVYKYCLDL